MNSAPWFPALRERVEECYAAPMLSRAEALALLDIADAAHDAVVVNGWDEPRESIVVTNPELKRLADAVLAYPSRAEDSQERASA